MPNTLHFPAKSPVSTSPFATALAIVEPDPSLAQSIAIGLSAAWRKLQAQADMAAPHLQIATIEGESGSGKQTLARYLHNRSPHASGTFQRRDAREWLATDADPSTVTGFIYLDRVDLLAAPGQGLLLSVLKALQDRAPSRASLVVSSQTPVRQMAAQGQLQPDLAFRLTAIRFAVPPLRQRREDIAPLAQSILDSLCQRYQQRPVALGPGALARLLQHNWPGNIRELASILETALLEATNGLIRPSDLALPDPTAPEYNSIATGPAIRPPSLELDAVIRNHVRYVLDISHGNKLRAARQLQISRSTLYRILANQSPLSH